MLSDGHAPLQKWGEAAGEGERGGGGGRKRRRRRRGGGDSWPLFHERVSRPRRAAPKVFSHSRALGRRARAPPPRPPRASSSTSLDSSCSYRVRGRTVGARRATAPKSVVMFILFYLNYLGFGKRGAGRRSCTSSDAWPCLAPVIVEEKGKRRRKKERKKKNQQQQQQQNTASVF